MSSRQGEGEPDQEDTVALMDAVRARTADSPPDVVGELDRLRDRGDTEEPPPYDRGAQER